MTYGLGSPIISTIRGVEIRLDSVSIYRIFDIALVGLRVYKSKIWPTVPGFEPREVIQRICGFADAQEMSKPSAHNLTIISRVPHHMICSIFLPQGGHRDEVSYYEAFLIDLILIGRQIHLGHLMMMHMISCCESTTRVLPYGHFFTRVFKDVGVDLSREIEFEAPSAYHTYDDLSMRRMKFEKAPDGSWVRRVERPLAQARGQGQAYLRVKEEVEIQEMEGGVAPQSGFQQREPELDILPLQLEGVQFEATFSESMMFEQTYTVGPSSQPSFTEPPHTEIPPHQAPHLPDHAPQMDLSTQISFLGTRIGELVVVSDTQFYSMEYHMDQYQVGFTSLFEHLQQRFEHLEDRMDQHQVGITSQFEHLQQWIKSIEDCLESQHEEMMAYLRSMFLPLPPQP